MRCRPRCVTTLGHRSCNLEPLTRPARPSIDKLMMPRWVCRPPAWDLIGHKVCRRPRLYWHHLRGRRNLWTRKIQWDRAFNLPPESAATSRHSSFIGAPLMTELTKVAIEWQRSLSRTWRPGLATLPANATCGDPQQELLDVPSDNTGSPTRRFQRSIRPRTATPSRGLHSQFGTCLAAVVVSCDLDWQPRWAVSNVDANGVCE
jgi:hypothetical protein